MRKLNALAIPLRPARPLSLREVRAVLTPVKVVAAKRRFDR
jgi:hypothetical protein